MAAYTVCRDPKCATLVEGKVEACPKCGGAMRIVGESPWRGITLLICGLVLVLGMGVITINMYPSLTNPGVSIEGTTWEGTAEQARTVLLLFAAVIVFGLVATANGVYMMITKTQSKAFMFVSLGLAALLLVITFVTMFVLKDDKPEPTRIYSTY